VGEAGELQKWLGTVTDEDPDGMLVDVLIGYYATPEPDPDVSELPGEDA